MWRLIAGIAALVIGGVIVYNIYVSYLNRKKARQISKNKAQELNRYISKAVVKEIEYGNISVVHIDLFNNSEKVSRLKIEADEVSDDLEEGDVLYL